MSEISTRNKILFTLIYLILSGNSLNGNFFNFDPQAALYNPAVDHVELLNNETFDNVVFNSDRVSLVKFFAHWCGQKINVMLDLSIDS